MTPDPVRQPPALTYALIVGVVVSAAFSGASVLYQLTERAHVHPGVPTGWESSLGIATDFVGFVVIVLVAIQLFWGYRVASLPWARYKTWHPTLGLTIAAVLAAHGITGTAHSLIGQIESIPIVLDFIGLGLALFVGVLVWSGYRQLAHPRSGIAARATHSWVVVALAIVVSLHALVGVYHTITG